MINFHFWFHTVSTCFLSAGEQPHPPLSQNLVFTVALLTMWQRYQGVCFCFTSCFPPQTGHCNQSGGVYRLCAPSASGGAANICIRKNRICLVWLSTHGYVWIERSSLFYKWRTWKSLLLHCVEWCFEGDVVRKQLLSGWIQHFKSTCRYICQMSSFQGKWTNWVRKTLFVLSFSTELGLKRWTESLTFNKFTKITLKFVFKNSDP